MQQVNPEVVIHMAAQPLVRESYVNPVETYAVNVMGTVHVLEACRYIPSVKAVINVTSDKCYENREIERGYTEEDRMGGFDPYSSSKGCSELVTAAYRNSFFPAKKYESHEVAVATARAGNVIGGGDWAADRLIPDFVRAMLRNEELVIRYPMAKRPWQHVLEPLTGYLLLAEKLYTDGSDFAEAWNFGPDKRDIRSVEWIIQQLCGLWGGTATYRVLNEEIFHEAGLLQLDCAKANARLKWTPVWDIAETLQHIVSWNLSRISGTDVREITLSQIKSYFNDGTKNVGL